MLCGSTLRKASAFLLVLLQLNGYLCASLESKNIVDNAVALDDVEIAENLPAARSLVENCEGFFNPTCIKLRFISLIDKFSNYGDFTLYPGVTLVKERNEDKVKTVAKLEEISRSFPNEPDQRVSNYLFYKIGSFIDNHSLRVKLLGEESARSLMTLDDSDDEYEEIGSDGRSIRRKKKKKIAALIGILALVKGVFGALATGAIFVLASKALLTGLIALLISGFLGFRAFTEGNAKTAKPEEVAVHHPSHWHSSHDDYPYARSINFELPEHLSKKE